MCSRHNRTPKARSWLRPLVMACGLLALAVTEMGCAQVRHALGEPDVVIGTANPADIGYPLGGSICRLFNLNTPDHGLRCGEVISEGAVANIESLRYGRIDAGIVPSDVLADAVAGQGEFASRRRMSSLRVLFAGHAEVFTLVAHQDSGIRNVADLRGKRVGIGEPGSRQRANMERVMAAFDLKQSDLAELRELSPAEQSRAFCDNELDAIVYSVAHPNGLIRDATRTCQGMLVPVSGPDIDRMLSDYPEYEPVAIAGGTYPANPSDVRTFAVRAVVVTTKSLPDTAAYELAKAVSENFDDFRRLHPAFEDLSVTEMIPSTERAPIHAGAARYYRERDWMP